ncbi:MAG: hypothetical protein LBL26_06665 [Peptococcaceae bacterium]|nr:hypothetical protein [Peptococcaceae bacterium]
MDKIGLITDITDSEAAIDQGRKWLDTAGYEVDGRIRYRHGLSLAMMRFKDAQILAPSDLETLVLAEYIFLTQELHFCDPTDTQAYASLTRAIRSFDDAFLALQTVETPVAYRNAETTYPHHYKYRVKEMPKDAFHIACALHRTRIQNILRAPGINLAEKDLLIQRSANMTTAQTVYLTKQYAALNTVASAASQERTDTT